MTAQESRGGVIEHRIGADGSFALAISSGAVDLHGVDGDTVRIATADPDDAGLLDRFEVEAGDGSLRVRSTHGVLIGVGVFGRQFRWGGGVGELDLIVEMPRSARLELATVSGDVHAAGTNGKQHYKTVSGGMELTDVGGEIEVDSTSGDVAIDASTATTLKLRTISGDLAAKAPLIRRLQATSMSGDLRVESSFEAGQDHSIETVSGDTRLVTGSGLTIEARTVSGDIRSDTPHRTGGGAGRRAIVVGDGKARLLFRSLSGDLQLVGRGASTSAAEGASWRGSAVETDPNESARLEILRALAAGEIDVSTATDRLAELDQGTLLRLVAEGRLTAEEAAPLMAALDQPTTASTTADDQPAKGDAARHVRVEVTEHGRSVVNLRVPLSLGQAAVSYVPGLDSGQAARVREALARGITGPIIEIADEDGDGVRIVLE